MCSSDLATGVIAASGTLAQIVPPSLVLIVLADQLGASVGDMYKGALLPGLIMVALYLAYVFAVTIFRPHAAPALPASARTLHGTALLLRVLTTLLPPLVLIFLVLGTIFIGVATPTEGGALGAAGALLLALARGRLSRLQLTQAMDSTTRLTTFVIFILIGSTIFTLVFRGLDGDVWVEHLFNQLPGGVFGFLVVVNLLVFVLAFFLDFFEIAFIVVPLVGPIAYKLGIDPIWFGVMLAVNMQTAFMHPPFGFALFYLKSVAPRSIRTGDIYRGAIPFLVIQLIMVAVVLGFPQVVLRDAPPDASSVTTIPLDIDPDTGFLPAEWR